MGFDKEKIRQIRRLMILAAVLVLALKYSNTVISAVFLGIGILKPFLYGGAIAFVLNIPMKGIEKGLLKKWRGKWADRLKRPVCMVSAIVLVVLVINLVIITVLPQVTRTAGELGNKIPAFVDNVVTELEKWSAEYPQIQDQVAKLETLEINWDTVVKNIVDFLKNGVGNVLTSTVSVASSIIGGVVNMVVALIFALYVLAQKEKLADQGKRILSAYLPVRADEKIAHIMSLLYRNFSNFITGQCLEAVILGTMFVVAMAIFRMPYAVMIGVLIAFTALIPIVGAFIGCFVGAFLILINNPMQAVWFVVLFLILQQIEGNLIYPKVVGSSVGLPSIWVLMAVSVGGSLFGIAGMLFFIPLVSTVYMLLRESVNARNGIKERLLPDKTAEDTGQAGAVSSDPAPDAGRPATVQKGISEGGKTAPQKEAESTEAPSEDKPESVSLEDSGKVTSPGRRGKRKRK